MIPVNKTLMPSELVANYLAGRRIVIFIAALLLNSFSPMLNGAGQEVVVEVEVTARFLIVIHIPLY